MQVGEKDAASSHSRIRCFDASGARYLPDWAKYYMGLGELLSDVSSPGESTLTLVLTVPTREFAVPLVATGLVLGMLSHPAAPDELHLQKLKALPEGTRVILRSGGRKYSGNLVGYSNYGSLGGAFFEVRIDQVTSKYVSPDDADQIEVADDKDAKLPKSSKGRKLNKPGGLASQVLPEDLATDLALGTQLDLVIIGQPSGSLRKELQAKLFTGPQVDGDQTRGSLQDIARIKRYLPSGSAYRGIALSQSNRRMPSVASTYRPHLVVFDGALAFLKWGSHWRNSHRLALFDMTERSYEEALKEVNGEFVQDRVEPGISLQVPPPMKPIGGMIYTVHP